MNKKLSKLIVGAFALVLSVPNANAQTMRMRRRDCLPMEKKVALPSIGAFLPL